MDVGKETLYPKARSYYAGNQIPGKPHVVMRYSAGLRGYRRKSNKSLWITDGSQMRPQLG